MFQKEHKASSALRHLNGHGSSNGIDRVNHSSEPCLTNHVMDSEVSNLTDQNSILFERSENMRINEDRLDVYINKFGGGEPSSPPNVSSFQNSISQYQNRSSRPGN
jgi:hypothetical protein